MTYRELLNSIDSLDEEQLDLPVYAQVDGEFYKAKDFEIHEKNGNLNDGHPYIVIV